MVKIAFTKTTKVVAYFIVCALVVGFAYLLRAIFLPSGVSIGSQSNAIYLGSNNVSPGNASSSNKDAAVSTNLASRENINKIELEQAKKTLLAYLPTTIPLKEVKENDLNLYEDIKKYTEIKGIKIKNNTVSTEELITEIFNDSEAAGVVLSAQQNSTTGGATTQNDGAFTLPYKTPAGANMESAKSIISFDKDKNPLNCAYNAAVEIKSCNQPEFLDSWIGFKAKYIANDNCVYEGVFVLFPATGQLAQTQAMAANPGDPAQINISWKRFVEQVETFAGFNLAKPDGTVFPPLPEIIQQLGGSAFLGRTTEVGTGAAVCATNEDCGSKLALQFRNTREFQITPGATDAIPRAEDEPLKAKQGLTPNTALNVSTKTVVNGTAYSPTGNHHSISTCVLHPYICNNLLRVVTSCLANASGYTERVNWYSDTLGNLEETTSYNQGRIPTTDRLNAMLLPPSSSTLYQKNDDGTYKNIADSGYEDAVGECRTSTGKKVSNTYMVDSQAFVKYLIDSYRRTLPPMYSDVFNTKDFEEIVLREGRYIKAGSSTDPVGLYDSMIGGPSQDKLLFCLPKSNQL